MKLTIDETLKQAIAFSKEGKIQDAERLYRAILQTQPTHPDANHNLGLLAVSRNKIDAALPLFKKALKANPKKEQFWFSYIDALIKEKKFEAAKKVIEQVKSKGMAAAKLQIFEEQFQSKLSPSSDIRQQKFGNQSQNHQDQLSPAIELREAGKYKEAQEWLSEVIAIDSRNAEALSLLSQVLLLDKKDTEAERVLTTAASIDSKLPSIYRNQARLLLKQSKTKEALGKAQSGCKQSPEEPESLLVLAACLGANQRDLEALPIIEKILKAKPNYAEAIANRALIKFRAKDITGAIEDAQMTVSLKPHLTQMWQLLSSMYYQCNNLNDAIEALRSAHKNEPENSDFMVQLGEFLRQDNKVSEAIAILEQATKLAPEDASTWTNLGVAFQQETRIADAKIAYKKALSLNPKSAAISSNLGAMAKEAEEWESALQYFAKAVEIEPNLAEAHSNLGITLNGAGRLDEAEESHMRAIALRPDYAEAHSHLGSTLKELGRLDEAKASFSKAITFKPDYAEAHYNLGITLSELGKLNEAEASYVKAITLKPSYTRAHYNLGNTLRELERFDEAIVSYLEAIRLNPDFTSAYVNFNQATKKVSFNSSNPQLYPVFENILTIANITRPKDVAGNILSLLKHDPLIMNLLPGENNITSLSKAESAIKSLNKLTLLHHLMRLCPLPDLQLEGLFTIIRSFILTNLYKIETSPKLTYFLSTLSLHCFTNEYVFHEKYEETQLLEKLETEIAQKIALLKQPEPKEILCLASYRPLHRYHWCQMLEVLDHIEEVKARLIDEPFIERAIAKAIPVLGEISNSVSLKVKEQYEENPYPRWIKLSIPTMAKSIAAVCDNNKLHLHSESIKSVKAPTILIAGCGTGQHSIETASTFASCHATAVDLSFASLAYAQRKTNELGITNLKYLQADILKLDQLKQKFHIIESSGVLHHMDDPMAGWKVLTGLLKPGGLMRIGLYSELARRHIVKVREEIKSLGVETSETDIREFRLSLAESHGKGHQLLTKSNDFFSLSTLRDLIFHVQEHRFTIPKIQECLDLLGLKFCGFENEDIVSRFKEFHSEDSDVGDLTLWHEYEETNPRAFAGMYQFWCQKQ